MALLLQALCNASYAWLTNYQPCDYNRLSTIRLQTLQACAGNVLQPVKLGRIDWHHEHKHNWNREYDWN